LLAKANAALAKAADTKEIRVSLRQLVSGKGKWTLQREKSRPAK
jgi:hypothetical protein